MSKHRDYQDNCFLFFANFPRFFWKIGKILLFVLALSSTFVSGKAAYGLEWTVTTTIHEILTLTGNDAWKGEDFYSEIWIRGKKCTFSPLNDQNHIKPQGWTCSDTVSDTNVDVRVGVVIKIFEDDIDPNDDDHVDIHPTGSRDLTMVFFPGTQKLEIKGFQGWTSPRCAIANISSDGHDGEDAARIFFSVSASAVGAPDGDSDGDGLLDSWEVCGHDGDGDGVVDVDLPGMGADPYRKDVFVEIDWMIANTHTHEPWLPALMIAWNEFNLSPITNPTVNGKQKASGISLHLDVGTLYSNYNIDFDGDGTNEIEVGPDGNIDMDDNGIPDIGNLGNLGTGTAMGGNALWPEKWAFFIGSNNYFDQGSTFHKIKTIDSNFNPIREKVFRYSVFGHLITLERNGGVAECGGIPACNDFIVSLGGWGVQTLDKDGDGVPDRTNPPTLPLLGPSNIPVDGTIVDHAAVFLHELGHTMTLGHGGGDGVNFKPNYLSIMNYAFPTGLSQDFDGNGTADSFSADFDGDTIPDKLRFIYSSSMLPELDENQLDEASGISADNFFITEYYCPPPNNNPRTTSSGGPQAPIDWNCNTPMSTNPFIDSNPVNVDINGDINVPNGNATILSGFNDNIQITSHGFAFQEQTPSISLKELHDLRSKTTRIIAITNPSIIEDQCVSPLLINFEDQIIDTEKITRGTVINTQYGPSVTFLNDQKRQPTIFEQRLGPTQSPKNFLANLGSDPASPFLNPAPLVIDLNKPQRMIGLYVGRSKKDSALDIVVVLRAFDTDGLPMGQIRRNLQSFKQGITQFIGIGAIFPHQLIRRIEIEFLDADKPKTVQIDDLTVCPIIDNGKTPPELEDLPKFGDHPVTVVVSSSIIEQVPEVKKEKDRTPSIELPFPNIPITWDKTSISPTEFKVIKQEGQSVTFIAPKRYRTHTFLHWKYNNNVQFPDGQNELSLKFLKDGKLTAIYEPKKTTVSSVWIGVVIALLAIILL